MKTIIALLAVTAICLAAEGPYTPAGSKAQGALLLLPLQQAKGNTNTTSTTPRPVSDRAESLEDVNAKILEKLKQEPGTEQGVYHVYLQDGRLQRVQYATAPIASGQQAQQQQPTSNNYNQQQQIPEILSPEFAGRRGAYFVQVPQERIQALQANAQQVSQQNGQNYQASAPAQYSQQPSFPVNVRYQPLEETPAQTQFAAPNSQYNQQPSSEAFVRYLPLEDTPAQIQLAAPSSQYNQQPSAEAVVRYLPIPLTEQTGQYNQQESASGNLASVQYTEVQPIQGPVYSYKPDAVARILRYAPVY